MTLEIRTPEIRGTKRESVELFLERYGRALVTGDVETLANLWETPALVLADAGVLPVTTREEIVAFFSKAKASYEAQGVLTTEARVLRLEWLSERIATVEVRWPYVDAQGREMGGETSTYTLRRDESGQLRLRAAIMHGTRDDAR